MLSRLGYLFIKPSLNKVITKTDPRKYNGALFIGLNGIVVKSHGGTDAFGFANAIGVAVDLVDRNLNKSIAEELDRLYENSDKHIFTNGIQ